MEEYLALVEESDVKPEFHYGRIFVMVGGNSNHSIIGTNIHLFTFEIDIPLAQIYAKTESLQDPDQFLQK